MHGPSQDEKGKEPHVVFRASVGMMTHYRRAVIVYGKHNSNVFLEPIELDHNRFDYVLENTSYSFETDGHDLSEFAWLTYDPF
jgi:hypothetical protein